MGEIITSCPVCTKGIFSEYLKVNDHFLSREEFVIQECNNCGFRFVNPRPGPEEIGPYYQSEEYISHGAKKQDLMSRVYRLARIFSIRTKFGIVKKYCRSGKILDIGCGTGEFLGYCRKQGYEVSGVEPNERARSFAESENKIPVAEQLKAYKEKQGSYACITMWHVLEHVHELNLTMESIRELLAPDGVFIAAVPNCNSWDASKYGAYWAAYDVPRHLYHFTSKTLNDLASRNGFEVVKILPQKMDAYYVSMLSEKYLNGKVNYLKALFYGLWSNFSAKKEERGNSSLIFVLKRKKA